jgi:beta-lactamase superfamily II metal-dependent hydrolase
MKTALDQRNRRNFDLGKSNLMRVRIILLALFVFVSTVNLFSMAPEKSARRTLDIYYVDVEGGAATLIVTPAGESVLIDAGWPGFDGRDAKRIQQAMQQAGITTIDHLIATHYHVDHFGGIPELARLVPIKNFYDHGKMTSLADDDKFAERYSAYQAAAKNQTATLKPGNKILLKSAAGTPPISLQCLAAHGEVINETNYPFLPSKRVNQECISAAAKEEDKSDNARSIVMVLRFGGFDFLDGGDLTWNIEERLVCPLNYLGEIDLYQVTHHGLNISNNPVLLRSIRPTVAIMNNGARKGGHPDTVKWLQELPTLKALYQLHRNVTSTDQQNAPPEFIANLTEQPDAAHMITVSVDPAKRAFTVTNARTNDSKSFPFK